MNTPRDRENTFEPQLIKKHQTRITRMDSQILSLYAKGMTTREIVANAWDDKYPQISKSWRAHWENLNTFFGYPQDHLHHECHRVAEQRDPRSYQEAQDVPDG